MTVEHCFLGICFIPLNPSGQKFFGFSEFLTGLALMVLAWTIADVRYRFRIRCAPIPLQKLTFSVVTALGILTLLTDLWRAEQWLVPEGNLLTPETWQALLGGLFLLTFLTWAWFAFIRPPIYGRYNAERYAHTLYRFILKGSSEELSVIADELTGSAKALVKYAPDLQRLRHSRREDEEMVPTKVEGYASDILLLIANKKMCRVIVESSPGTALAFFLAITDTKKYGVHIETFAKNIVSAALANKDSFLYHEVDGYESGLLGYHKPLSQTMFGNYRLVEAIGALLTPDFDHMLKWDASQLKAYCRVVLMTFRSYVTEKHVGNLSVFYRAFGNIEHAVSDLYKLNEQTGTWDTDAVRRLGVVVEFIKDAVKVLDEEGAPSRAHLRIRQQKRVGYESIYDLIANTILDVIIHASAVKAPQWECWSIQHNSLWGDLFYSTGLEGKAGNVVKFKVRRLLYNEIAEMCQFPNFKGAKILGFCLNVLGFFIENGDFSKDSRALQKVVLRWTRKNFIWLHEYNPHVAEACLVDGITYDAGGRRLVRTLQITAFRKEPHYDYLQLEAAPGASG